MGGLPERQSFINDVINKIGTALLAITLALIVWLVSVNQENPSVQDVFPEPIPIELHNQPPGTIVFGEPVDRVQLTIRAPRTSWDNLRASSFQAWVDLAGLTPDIHNLDVQVKCSDRAVKILDKKPSTVSIRLEPLKEKQLDVKASVIDSVPLGYISLAPTVTPPTVTVKGPGSAVDQVQSVAADIYLQGAKADLEKAVALVPHDAQGETVSWVELDPPRVKVNVPIEQRIGYKDVSVRVVLKGQVARGYRITNVSVDPSIVTVVGNPAELNAIGGYLETKPVDVTDAKADVVARVPLAMSQGVSLLGTQGVVVTVNVMPLEGGLNLQELPLTWQGLEPNLTAKMSPRTVDVILSGPLPKLEPLTRSEVQVIVDVYGLAPGVHKVTPTVIVPEGIKVESMLPDIVEVEIAVSPGSLPLPPLTSGTPPTSATALPVATIAVTPTAVNTQQPTIAPGEKGSLTAVPTPRQP